MSVRSWARSSAAAALARELPAALVPGTLAVVVGASLGLIVLPNYVNQVRNLAGVAADGPLVLAVGRRCVLLQLADGGCRLRRIAGAAVLYGVFAIWAALARRRRSSRAAVA